MTWMLAEDKGPWRLSWQEACICCKGRYHFETKRAAVAHIERLSKPFVAGQTTLKRFNFKICKLKKPWPTMPKATKKKKAKRS